MNAPISKPAPEVFLSLKWTVSHARATHGWKVLTLTDHHIFKTCRTIGGGYDMEGTVFAEWLAAVHSERLQAVAARASDVYTPGRGIARADIAPGTALYGMTRNAETSAVLLDGGCGLQSMLTIAETAGLSVRKLFNNRGRLGGFVVTVAVAATEGGAA